MGEKKNTNWTLIVLIALLVITIGYIAISEYNSWKSDYKAQAYQQGVQDATLQIAQRAAQCQQVPLNTGANETVNLVSVKCVQQARQQAAQQQVQDEQAQITE